MSTLTTITMLLALSTWAWGEEAKAVEGLVHIECEPGCWIVWDGQVMGRSRECYHGFVVHGPAPGEYDLSVYRPGYRRRDVVVEIGAEERVTAVRVPEAKPRVRITQGLHAEELPAGPPQGGLSVASAPPDGCVIHIPAQGLEAVPAAGKPLIVDGLEEGVYQVTFERRDGAVMSLAVLVEPAMGRKKLEADWARGVVLQDGKAPEGAPAEVGRLQITSTPTVCKVDFPTMGWKGRVKKDEVLEASSVPAGTHAVTFVRLDKKLHAEIPIEKGMITRIHVDWEQMEVRTEAMVPE